MDLKILHTTRYTYEEPVAYALQRLRLTPTDCPGQEIRSWRTRLEGATIEAGYLDHFGNRVELASATPATTAIRVIAEGTVATSDVSGVVGPHVGFAPLWLFRRETALTKPGRRIRELARATARDGTLDCLHALAKAVRETVAYVPGRTDAGTTAEEAMESGAGVCQDQAHVFVAAARTMDIPARYVSGYLKLDGDSSEAESHAWAEAHVEGLGWVGFDPSNGISPDARYVRVATGLDYRDAAPVSGIRMGSAAEALAVSVFVEQ